MDNSKFIVQMPILDEDAAAQVYEFLQEMIRVYESHYGAQLNAYYADAYTNDTQGDQRNLDDEIPF